MDWILIGIFWLVCLAAGWCIGVQLGTKLARYRHRKWVERIEKR